ncbi:MAG: ABC transporter ATP-binding protein [Spirochaetaceae bacterium]|jgi:iron complex transport system ATP-binding protein|nr:ABC transporter ATP-binding protein [Spirochaetaceae bacterium]
MLVTVARLSAGYGGADVIKDIEFEVRSGESLAVLGTNGCGKSTLLKAMGRLIGYRGTVSIDSRDITGFSRRDLAKNIALLGQNTPVCFPYTVRETVSLGRYAYGRGLLPRLSREDERRIAETMDRLDLTDIKDRMIDELSGGQIQRVFLAKTIVQDPGLILLDEPANHLDLKNRIEILGYLKQWVGETGKTLVGVYHDLTLVHHFADRALLMKSGRLAAWGSVRTVLTRETLQEVYGIDVFGFMRASLSFFQPQPPQPPAVS